MSEGERWIRSIVPNDKAVFSCFAVSWSSRNPELAARLRTNARKNTTPLRDASRSVSHFYCSFRIQNRIPFGPAKNTNDSHRGEGQGQDWE
jgi:hypothetical protein